MYLSFTVPVVPVSQPRPRAVNNRGHAKVIQASSKHKIHGFKADVRQAMEEELERRQIRGLAFRGGVHVKTVFCFPRASKRVWKTKPMPPELHLKKPDIDNLLKSILDAMSGRVFRDDTHVCASDQLKYIGAGVDRPHVYVLVSEFTEQHLMACLGVRYV